jgi:hypothetical protein
MKRILTVAAALLLSNMAFAEGSSDNGSQYQHQTASGLFELTPAVNYETTTKKFKNGGAKHDFTITNERLMGEYGIDDMFSVGLTLTNTDTQDKTSGSTTHKYQGLMDPDLFLNGRSEMGSGSLRFGTHLTISAGDMKTDTTGLKTNGYSGSTTLTPFVGYEMKADSMTYGARLVFDLYKTPGSWKMDPNTKAKIRDGKQIVSSIFFEQDVNPVTWGVDVQLENHQKTYLDFDGGGSLEALPAYNRMNFNVYAAYLATDSITILPTLSYINFSAGPKDVDSQTGFAGQIAGRFAF